MSQHLGDSTSDAIQLRRHSKKSCVRNTCDQTTRHTSLLRTDPVAVRYSTLLSSQCGTAVRAHKEVSASQVSTGLLTLDHSRVISRGQDQPSASEDSLHDRLLNNSRPVVRARSGTRCYDHATYVPLM
jgi:hypothetical protein